MGHTDDPIALSQKLVARPVRTAAALLVAAPAFAAAAALSRVSLQVCRLCVCACVCDSGDIVKVLKPNALSPGSLRTTE